MQKYFNWRKILLVSSVVICTSLITVAAYSQFLQSNNEEAKYFKAINDAYWDGPNADKIATAIIDLDNYYKELQKENIDSALAFVSTVPKWNHCGTMYLALKKNTVLVADKLREKHRYSLAEPLYKDVLASSEYLSVPIEIAVLQGYGKLLRDDGKADTALPYESKASKLITEEKWYEYGRKPPRIWY